MAKTQAVWAIDVGQAAMKALKLVPGENPDQVVAEAFDFIEYPKILSQPDADPEELVREALTTFLDRNDLKGCKVAISVPGQAGLVKFIKLPPVEKKRIPDIVKFEARQQIPFALEEVIWDYQQIGGGESDGDDDFSMAEVGLFAMKRDQINRAMQPIVRAGIEVDIVQMGPIALFNFIAFDRLSGRDKAADQGSVVLLDIGVDNTDLIITDGIRIWQRNVPIGGNHFTRALTKELKQTFAKAEHLKRNATKAPDPRAIFTAMRGVFNDFASEVNRSIGFFTSVNRTAKISRVIGLGNGFKLPGLQKFLQQNLSYEVDKLETFERLAGEDVISSPQFQENLPSFAVAYGLGVQGLGKSQLRTNLLPPEIEQVRMVRRKKPWALAASALLMLGFSALFLGDWKAWATVKSKDYQDAVSSSKSVIATGTQYKTAFEEAEGNLKSKLNERKALIAAGNDDTSWAALLHHIDAALPNPIADLTALKVEFNSEDPHDRPMLDQSRIYIDAIKPVWRTNLNTEWFKTLPDFSKNLMLPYDRKNDPKGAGWVIQVVGHHYNPYPTPKSNREVDLGPRAFLIERFIKHLGTPQQRHFGIHHPALAWLTVDTQWTGEKGAEGGGTGLPPAVPLLARATPPVAAVGAASKVGGMGGMGGGMAFPGMPGAGGASGMGTAMTSAADAMKGMGGMPGMGGMGGMGAAGKAATKNQTVLTRTNFKIEFIWQPATPKEPAKDVAMIQKEIQAAEKAAPGSFQTPNDDEIKAQSAAASQKAVEEVKKVVEQSANAGASGGPTSPPGTNPASGVPAPPVSPMPAPGPM